MENSIGIVIIALIAFFLLGYFIAHKRYQKSIVSLNAIKKENEELFAYKLSFFAGDKHQIEIIEKGDKLYGIHKD